MKEESTHNVQLRKMYRLLYLCVALVFVYVGLLIFNHMTEAAPLLGSKPEPIAVLPIEEDIDRIENGIHVRTGLVDAEGLMVVVNNCTNCHSAKIITQNRMTKERWDETIKWMQETQNLWELGTNQDIIVDYLVMNYPPKRKGRRMVLQDIDWYELED